MTITVKINTDTPTGKRLEKELRRHPKTVQFVDPAVSGNLPDGFLPLKDGFAEVRNHVKSLYE